MATLAVFATGKGLRGKKVVNIWSKNGSRSANYGRCLKRLKMVIGVEEVKILRRFGKTGVDLAVKDDPEAFGNPKGTGVKNTKP